jgi:hypothetical protein
MKIRAIPRMMTVVLALLVAGGLVAFGWHALRRSAAEIWRTFKSPDGCFEIVVYRMPSLIAMPGQSSDAPGFFQLRDKRTGRVVRESSVEMVQLVDQVEWSSTNVFVGFLAEWSLRK